MMSLTLNQYIAQIAEKHSNKLVLSKENKDLIAKDLARFFDFLDKDDAPENRTLELPAEIKQHLKIGDYKTALLTDLINNQNLHSSSDDIDSPPSKTSPRLKKLMSLFQSIKEKATGFSLKASTSNAEVHHIQEEELSQFIDALDTSPPDNMIHFMKWQCIVGAVINDYLFGPDNRLQTALKENGHPQFLNNLYNLFSDESGDWVKAKLVHAYLAKQIPQIDTYQANKAQRPTTPGHRDSQRTLTLKGLGTAYLNTHSTTDLNALEKKGGINSLVEQLHRIKNIFFIKFAKHVDGFDEYSAQEKAFNAWFEHHSELDLNELNTFLAELLETVGDDKKDEFYHAIFGIMNAQACTLDEKSVKLALHSQGFLQNSTDLMHKLLKHNPTIHNFLIENNSIIDKLVSATEKWDTQPKGSTIRRGQNAIDNAITIRRDISNVLKRNTYNSQYYHSDDKSEDTQAEMLNILTQGVSETSQIINVKNFYLYLGGKKSAIEAYTDNPHQITAVIRLTHSSPDEEKQTKIPVHAFPIGDNKNNQSTFRKHLPIILQTIDDIKRKQINPHILIHCDAGCNRSPAILCAYLMRETGLRYDSIIQFLRIKRPCVGLPELTHEKALLHFEKTRRFKSRRKAIKHRMATLKSPPSASLTRSSKDTLRRCDSSEKSLTIAMVIRKLQDQRTHYRKRDNYYNHLIRDLNQLNNLLLANDTNIGPTVASFVYAMINPLETQVTKQLALQAFLENPLINPILSRGDQPINRILRHIAITAAILVGGIFAAFVVAAICSPAGAATILGTGLGIHALMHALGAFFTGGSLVWATAGTTAFAAQLSATTGAGLLGSSLPVIAYKLKPRFFPTMKNMLQDIEKTIEKFENIKPAA